MATVSETKTLLTAEQFLDLDLGEGRFQLVRGEVVELTLPRARHGNVSGRIVFQLGLFGRQTGFGYVFGGDYPVITARGPDTVRGPDVTFFSNARLPETATDTDQLIAIPPDLVAEIVSPSNGRKEIMAKVQEYLDAGVLLIWVVYPRRRTLMIYRPDEEPPITLAGADLIENLPELPGFLCPVAEFFPPQS